MAEEILVSEQVEAGRLLVATADNAGIPLRAADVSLHVRPHSVTEALRPSLGQAASVARVKLRGTTVGNRIVDNAVLYRLERAQAG